MFIPYELVNKCRMLYSNIYEFIIFSIAMFLCVAIFSKAERRALLHLCRNAHHSGATQGTMPSFRFSVLKTKIDNYVVTARTCEKFFGGKLNLVRGEDGGLHGAWYYCSFKAPSTYASVATMRRLASTVRVHWFTSDPFQKHSGNRSGFGLKRF
jgi:hypothetical protein